MSFVDYLLKYYVLILVVLVLAIITVIGFLADARLKKKKLAKVEKSGKGENNPEINSEVSSIVPQPINEQSIMTQNIGVQPSPVVEPLVVNEMVAPVGDVNVGTIELSSQPQMEVPTAPVMPAVESVAPVVQPQMEVPVAPVMPTAEPVAPVVQPQMEVPVAPVMPAVEPVAPIVQPQMEVPVAPVMPAVEPVAPVVQPQMEVPVAPVMPAVEPVAPVVQPQMEVPVAPVMPAVEPVAPVVQPQMEVSVAPVMPVEEPIAQNPVVSQENNSTQMVQPIDNFNAASMFVTGNN